MPFFPLAVQAPAQDPQIPPVSANYTKQEAMIPMRDGTKLYTAIYAPKDGAKKWPILMMRTAYGNGPYGVTRLRARLGPTVDFQKSGYIFVYQDVRGRWKSEGRFLYSPPPKKNKGPKDFDEGTDAYDTIEWLLKNMPSNNGRVGLYGTSQDGFYAAHALLSGHPAMKAVSPQAPVTDRFKGDDDHHNGAFFLAQRFSLLYTFGVTRPIPTERNPSGFRMPTADGYRFFLELGALPNFQKVFQNRNQHWQHQIEHPNYDEFWQVRGMEQYYRGLKGPAVLTVGGFFDAEDLYGALKTHGALDKYSRGIDSYLVMGPWSHGMWNGGDAERFGAIEFGSKTAKVYREEMVYPFFEHYLKDAPAHRLAKATMFETGANRWRKFNQWPPATSPRTLWLREKGTASFDAPTRRSKSGWDSYVSDPRRPVPLTANPSPGVPSTFMLENQRFAWLRPDVLSYVTEPLKEDMTLAGPIRAALRVTSTGQDTDFIVKLIDVYPETEPSNTLVTPNVSMAAYQMLVRWEVMRAKYRKSLSHPEPLVPGMETPVRIELNDVLHTFRKGHRVMVQIQSSMFPLIDRNPGKFLNIFKAKDSDFVAVTNRVKVGGADGSRLQVGVLAQPPVAPK